MLQPVLACPQDVGAVPRLRLQGRHGTRCGIIHQPVLPVHECRPHGTLHGPTWEEVKETDRPAEPRSPGTQRLPMAVFRPQMSVTFLK